METDGRTDGRTDESDCRANAVDKHCANDDASWKKFLENFESFCNILFYFTFADHNETQCSHKPNSGTVFVKVDQTFTMT